jgi:hypothetical protein
MSIPGITKIHDQAEVFVSKIPLIHGASHSSRCPPLRAYRSTADEVGGSIRASNAAALCEPLRLAGRVWPGARPSDEIAPAPEAARRSPMLLGRLSGSCWRGKISQGRCGGRARPPDALLENGLDTLQEACHRPNWRISQHDLQDWYFSMTLPSGSPLV